MMLKDVFFVHVFNDFSGSPRVLRDAIEACDECSGDRYLFTSRHDGFLDNAPVIRVPVFYRRSNIKLLQLFYYVLSQCHLFAVLSFYLIRSLKNKRKTSLLINTLLPCGAGIAGKLFASKVIYYVHESHISPRPLKQFLRTIIEWTADNVVFVSKYLLNDEFFKKPVQTVIYNGLRKDFIPNLDLDYPAKFKSRQVFFAGSLKDYKGIKQLALLAKVLEQFSFVAAINCSEHELTAYQNLNFIPANLVLLPRPDNVQVMFETSFCILNLSLPDQWVETFGLSLLEGMTFGCPAVAPPVGGPIEFVNPMNGLLSDSRDIDTISDFLGTLASDYEIWLKYSTNAQLCASLFTSEIYSSEFKTYMISNDFI
ncbi:hypothetical protein CXF86_19230 [Shewanella sp. GutCb]|uniref:glycosyltransferase family 4 protein n=1 Tax=Shewanella sp. GutCb TaxID=2058315 RepID=UPI000C7E7CD1|nr:glycosyltransferase family 4 protein [Shewanella sp. GutCb]PKG73140.1 hypothetical protein CXF86_19230 [Shewanella sp. GutCb]